MARLNIGKLEGFSLDNYSDGITKDDRIKYQKAEMLVIPYKYRDGEYYFAQETVNFIKFTKQQSNGVSIEILSDPNDIKIRSLHSFDIWMPTIYIATSILLPIIINIVSDYISELIKGRETNENKVKLTVIIKDGGKTKEIVYDGDVKNFKDAFEKIDITKL